MVLSGGGVTLKALSVAVLAGSCGVCLPAMATATDYQSHVSWEEVNSAGDNTVEVTLPNQDTKYYQFTYTAPDNYTKMSGPITGGSNTNIEQILFTETNIGKYSQIISNSKSNTINSINADFVDNSVAFYSSLISNSGTIESLEGNFINNNIGTSSSYYGYASLISNSGTIESLEGNFINNYNYSGSLISNSGTIKSLEGNFINNYNYSGSLISNSGTIESLKGNFINNNMDITPQNNYNDVVIENVTGFFANNRGSLNYVKNVTNSIFIKNGEVIIGSALHSAVNNIINSNSSSYGIIKDSYNVNIDSSAFINNKGFMGAAVNFVVPIIKQGSYFSENVENSIFIGNEAFTNGGAINFYANDKYYDRNGYDELQNYTLTIKNSSFMNNSVIGPGWGTSEDEDGNVTYSGDIASGGAIWSNAGVTTIIADDYTSIFSGNYFKYWEKEVDDWKEKEDDNAIYVAGEGTTLNFQLKNGGQIDMKDNIRGNEGYRVNIEGDDINNTVFYMHNDMYDANLTMGNTTINTINNDPHVYAFESLKVDSDTNFVADVNLETKEMDRYVAKSYGSHSGNLNVIGMNLLSDADPEEEVTAVYFAQPGLKNNVTHNGIEVPNDKYQDFEAYTPIYKYNVTYDNQNEYDGKGDGGYFLFKRGGNAGGNASEAFNPSVLSAPVSSVSASQATVNETFKYVFEHADAFTKMPSVDRMTKINANKYASTDFNENLCNLCESNNKAGWFRPYVTFETMNLNHGPKVNAITYGSLAGFDTDFHEHKHGWHSVGTGYIGYNGNQLHYSGVDTTMNGGLLGYTHTMYKGNFWSALTLSAGASVGESRTMYGKEDFTSLMAGVGTKTGYNFEFKEGKYILQPIMFMSYTFVNTFDYTNAGGVKIKPSPAHSIQLNPSVRFVANTKNGWQPYASVGMVWNVMNENKVMANSVRLPEMSMKPYVEYGLGIQRNWKDKFTAFGQAMIRNGGRNGIALTGGFRWALGKEAPKTEKVQNGTQAKDRTVLKQLTPAQKTALGARVQNTTRTTSNVVLKNL